MVSTPGLPWIPLHGASSVDSLEAQKLKRTEWSGCRNPGRFPFDEIFENFGWEWNGTGSFPEKIFEKLGQPFQYSRKVEISVFSKIVVFHSKVSSRTV